MIIYSHKDKFNIFEDYINCLFDNDLCEKYEYKLWSTSTEIIIDDNHDIVIFMQIIPNQQNKIILKNTKKINIFVCNTEQLSSSLENFLHNIKMFVEYCKNKNVLFGICDYSEQNINLLKTIKDFNDIPMHHLPYQYSNKDLQNLNRNENNKKKVCTCGVISKRRNKIISDLFEDHSLIINNAAGFLKIRDRIFNEHKIMLNISANDNFTIYEHIRCDRLIFSKMIIVSEKKMDYDKLDITDFVIWCDSEDIGDTIIYVLENYDEIVNNYDNNKMLSIIKKRREKYEDFIKKYSIS